MLKSLKSITLRISEPPADPRDLSMIATPIPVSPPEIITDNNLSVIGIFIWTK